MPTRLITPSQLSLFSISPVIGTWWQELEARKLFDGSKPAVSELDQQLFADGLPHKQELLTKLEKAGDSIVRLPSKQTKSNHAATRETMAQGVTFIHRPRSEMRRYAAVQASQQEKRILRAACSAQTAKLIIGNHAAGISRSSRQRIAIGRSPS